MRKFEAAEKKSMKKMQCLHVIPPSFLFIPAFPVVPRETNVNNISLIVFLAVLRFSLHRKDRQMK
jgi:hypothetical protein